MAMETLMQCGGTDDTYLEILQAQSERVPQLEENFTQVLFVMLHINKHLLSVLLNVYRNQIRRNLADFWDFNYTLELQDWWYMCLDFCTEWLLELTSFYNA